MSPSSPIFYAIGNTITESLDEILLGLSFDKKMISPKYFYDELGSNLFDEITKQPEYYLTRTEMEIFRCYTAEIVEQLGKDCLLIEYGSGNSQKIRVLLESLRPLAYAPLDISNEYLTRSVKELAKEYPLSLIHI